MRAIAVILGTAVLVGCSGPTPPGNGGAAGGRTTRVDPAMMKPIDDMVAESQDIGAIHRIDLAAHRVQVNRAAWALWEPDDRRTFTTSMAIYCDQHSSVHGKYVDIIDDNSGKTLAKYAASGVQLF